MEQRPSDSQNESANELPQSVAQSSAATPAVTDQPVDIQRTDDARPTKNPVSEPAMPDKARLAPVVMNSNQDEQTGESTPQDQLNQSGNEKPGQERSRQDKSGHHQERQRDGQPRQPQTNLPGNQSPKQGQPGNDRSGNQPRQQTSQPQKQNQPGQARGGQPNQPRQPNGQQPGAEKQREGNQNSKQNQSGPDKAGRSGNQPRNERSGHERSGQERLSRDTNASRDFDFDNRTEEDRKVDTRQPERGTNGPREETVRESDDRLMIGITLGDYNGIGPEVILKALQYNRLQKICTPVIYGSMRVLNRYRNLLELKDWNLNGIQQIEQASHKLTNVITCWPDQNQEIQPGKVTPEAGQAALACLQRAVEDLREGKLDAVVTAPINKHSIQSETFTFPGHTEYLAEAFSVGDNLMFLVSERLRVGVVTGHVPLGQVRKNITRERILQKLTMMSQSLRLDFGIDKPRIAVLGLNPHAGEDGLLGNEELEIVKPLIRQLQDKGNLVYGPFPADGFFGTRAYLKFDAVLAMYHDQGLIPFKAIAFEEGVNFTAAMPVVRTSPDHGTAYDIAGKNMADETSMLQAIYTACDVARRRREYAEIEAGALKPKRERAV